MNGVIRWKIAFLVFASFVAGAATGAFLIMGSAKDEMRHQRDPLRWFTNTPDRWRSEMKLTPEQAVGLPLTASLKIKVQDFKYWVTLSRRWHVLDQNVNVKKLIWPTAAK